MTTLPHWCSRLTPIKCSNGDCDKCIKASLGKRASRQVIFSLNESSRTRTEPAAAAATCSQTATGSWLLSIVFDRAYRNKGFQKRGHCERVRRAFFSLPLIHEIITPYSLLGERHRGPILRFQYDYIRCPVWSGLLWWLGNYSRLHRAVEEPLESHWWSPPFTLLWDNAKITLASRFGSTAPKTHAAEYQPLSCNLHFNPNHSLSVRLLDVQRTASRVFSVF